VGGFDANGQTGRVTPTAPSPTTVPWTAPRATGPVRATLALPGSKSMTARALVLSALSDEVSTIAAPLRARDTVLMAAGLRAMGCDVSTVDDTRWVVRPAPLQGPAHIDVGQAGTVLRFLPAVAALADGKVSFDGDASVRRRPLAPLLTALRTLGVEIAATDGTVLPLTVTGSGRVRGGETTIDASASSQFVSGLLLAAARFDRGVRVRHVGPAMPSAPHLRMTVQMLRDAGIIVDDSSADQWTVQPGGLTGRDWEIEPDLSGAAPFFAAALVTGGTVTLPHWPQHSTQPVAEVAALISQFGGQLRSDADGLTVTGGGPIHGIDVDLAPIGELTPVVAALAAIADGPSTLRGIGHLRGHETDRLAALARELGGLGTDITQTDDGLRITPRPLRGGGFHTYDDHRMAHAAAVIGLVAPEVRLSDVGCTAKTLPEFATLWSGMVRDAGQ